MVQLLRKGRSVNTAICITHDIFPFLVAPYRHRITSLAWHLQLVILGQLLEMSSILVQ